MTWTDPIVLVAIAGPMVAALLTGLAGLWLQNRHRRLRIAALRQALACEVDQIFVLLHEPPNDVWELGEGTRITSRDVMRHFKEDDIAGALRSRFLHGFDRSIYLANLDRIGDLHESLGRRTVRFYQAIAAYEAEMARFMEGKTEYIHNRPGPRDVFDQQLRMAVRAKIMAKRLRGERARPKFGRRRLLGAARAWLRWRKRLKES